MECDQGDAHDGEALADHQRDQGHVNDLRNAVDDVVKFGEEGVQLADIAPQTADGDTNRALTNTNDQRQLDGGLRCVPYLAPVVTTDVVGTKPIFAVRVNKCFRAVGYQARVVIFADCKRDEGEYNQADKNTAHDYCGFFLQEVLEYRFPVRVIRVADHLGSFRRILYKVKEFILVFNFLLHYFVLFHYLVPPLLASVILGSMIIIRTSPRNTPKILNAAYSITRVCTTLVS